MDYKSIIITVLVLILFGFILIQCTHEPETKVKYKTKIQEKIVYRDKCSSAVAPEVSSGSGLEYFEDIKFDKYFFAGSSNGYGRIYDADYAKVFCQGHIDSNKVENWINCSGEWIIKIKEKIH